jgi:hypothetical protein
VSIAPRPIALRLSFRFFVALIGWLGDDCAGAAAGTLHRPFLAGKGELIINQPRPEERAPKSGLPDFGISMVSKSATADFDSRVSKGGHRRGRAGGHPSRRRASHGSSE